MELMELGELGFEADLEAEITISAHEISQEKKDYNYDILSNKANKEILRFLKI